MERGLSPVTDLAQLQTGRVLVVRGCRSCGKNHVHVLGECFRRGVFFTTGTYHNSTSGMLDTRPAFREQRLFLAEPGTRIEDLMRGDLPV